MPHKLLLVEDEENLAKAILLNLDLERYDTTWIKNGNRANETLLSRPNFFDLIILDVMLPEKDGLSICKNVRNAGINTPILFLSARNSSDDKVLGLKAGADDYLGKPFNLEEFLLRVKILLNRTNGSESESSSSLEFGNNIFDPKGMTVTYGDNSSLSLSPLEVRFLKYLMDHKGEVVSRTDLIHEVWEDNLIKGRSIDNLISKFRKYLEEDPKNPKHFISIRGVGYRFDA